MMHAQSPHGEYLKIDCSSCHNPGAWTSIIEPMIFDHDSTSFVLEGQHSSLDCKMCHESMVFSDAPSDCIGCHNDIHSQSVGNDCSRCHSPESWLVDFIPELHEENGFPLIASHSGLSCVDCHISESNMRFDRLGNDCISCHESDFMSTQNPDHIESGFSTNCIDCHDPLGIGWSTEIVDHSFFPLTFGHEPPSCSECHLTSNFSDASPECVSCHLDDYSSAMDPDHSESGFSTNCAACHSTVEWTPAAFDHDNTDFPLMGGHVGVDCLQCHPDGYAGTPTECSACHLDDFNYTTEPDHEDAGFPTDCAQCHIEDSWTPATFDHDNTDFPLMGGHIGVNCIECHADGYAGTPTECVACHLEDFNNTSDPDHQSAQFPTDCTQCHNETAWEPSSFDHDDQHFPIYTGEHEGEWDQCVDCHTNPNDYSIFSCIVCHGQSDTADEHDPDDVPDYIWESNACFECHPDGSE